MAEEIVTCLLCGNPYYLKGLVGKKYIVGHHASGGCHADGQWGFDSEEEARAYCVRVNSPPWLVELARFYRAVRMLLGAHESMGTLKLGGIPEDKRLDMLERMEKPYEALPKHIRKQAEEKPSEVKA